MTRSARRHSTWRGSSAPKCVACSSTLLCLEVDGQQTAPRRLDLLDLWSEAFSIATDTLTVTVPAHGVRVFLATPR
jgi:hypothetical protein